MTEIRIVLVVLLGIFSSALTAQNLLVTGVVRDANSLEPIDLATVFVEDQAIFSETDQDGRYRIRIPKGTLNIEFSRIGYDSKKVRITENSASYLELDVELVPSVSDLEFTVSGQRINERTEINETTEAIKLLPTVSGNLESVLPHIALGARSGTGGELSSQYNVRGGNYDENLVYINDFEIFRPQLIRNSQQEGLSFPNIDLIRDLSFSSGGYESRYGDKMSSVLDISYKRPERLGGSFSASLLGASGHIEGASQLGKTNYQKLRYLVGARYKTNRYLLGSLDTKGQYTPNFTDIQTYLTYDFSKEWQLGVLANYNSSEFSFSPLSRATALGTYSTTLSLSSVFEGGEKDAFQTGMMGGSITYIPTRDKNPLFYKLLVSTYRGREIEDVDISGYYRLSQVETNLETGMENEISLIGVGAQQQYTRNRLFNKISNIEFRGGVEMSGSTTHFIQWGLKHQRENFNDRLNEWELIDSAGYSLPFSETEVLLNSVLKSENEISSEKSTLFLQDAIEWESESGTAYKLNVGSRISYWNWSNELTVSPRIQLLWSPVSDQNSSYKIAGGIYQQTPFYRELRRPDGSINNDLKSQKSAHLLFGMARDFAWKRVSDKPFRFIAEAYYKKFYDLIRYDIDNVRLRYSGENDARGYAMGLDMRLNGEFVKGAESWVNLSFLKTRESIDGVQHQSFNSETGAFEDVNSVSRPTDQAFNISIFFQDYLPRNENIKVNLNLVYGSGIPFGLPENNDVIRNTFSYSAYRRVDMGFAWQVWNEKNRNKKPNHLFRNFKNTWLTLEVFNLMGIENVSSNTWIKSTGNQYFAVPNKLTTRRINLRWRMEF